MPPYFTEREFDVLRMLGRGWTYSRIAAYLGIKPVSLRATHVANLLQKTGSRNQTELALYAIRHCYVPLDFIDFGVGSLIKCVELELPSPEETKLMVERMEIG